jgi:hypothetical protein
MVELPGKLYIVVCFGTLRKGDHFTYCVAYSSMPHHNYILLSVLEHCVRAIILRIV